MINPDEKTSTPASDSKSQPKSQTTHLQTASDNIPATPLVTTPATPQRHCRICGRVLERECDIRYLTMDFTKKYCADCYITIGTYEALRAMESEDDVDMRGWFGPRQ
jgi:hypothetical protein